MSEYNTLKQVRKSIVTKYLCYTMGLCGLAGTTITLQGCGGGVRQIFSSIIDEVNETNAEQFAIDYLKRQSGDKITFGLKEVKNIDKYNIEARPILTDKNGNPLTDVYLVVGFDEARTIIQENNQDYTTRGGDGFLQVSHEGAQTLEEFEKTLEGEAESIDDILGIDLI